MTNNSKVCYVWDNKLIEECDRIPAVVGRATMVHDLIEAYGLIKHMNIVRSVPATYADLKEFHSEFYLEHLRTLTEIDDDYICTEQDEEFGIGYDCQPVSNMFELVSTIAGSTVTAAKCLLLGVADVVINWCGGWHHAQRFGADGFCYVNDIVIGIEKLKKKFPKVLYVDLDVHHEYDDNGGHRLTGAEGIAGIEFYVSIRNCCSSVRGGVYMLPGPPELEICQSTGNGVQDAFNISKSVFTLSFHKFETGFYPGSGSLDEIGNLKGKGYSCNIPLHAGYGDDTMEYVFDKVFNAVYAHFAPDALVVQCGADAIALDPHGGARLTARSYCSCLKNVLRKRVPTMLLGGGGYKHSNAARLWTTLTSLVTNVTLDEHIPEHSHWTEYGPDYTLNIEPGMNKRDDNDSSYLNHCINVTKYNLNTYLPFHEFNGPDLKRLRIDDSTEESVSNQTSIFKAKNCDKGGTSKQNDDVYTFVD